MNGISLFLSGLSRIEENCGKTFLNFGDGSVYGLSSMKFEGFGLK